MQLVFKPVNSAQVQSLPLSSCIMLPVGTDNTPAPEHNLILYNNLYGDRI